MSSEVARQDILQMSWLDLKCQGLLGTHIEAMYAARPDTRQSRQRLAASLRGHYLSWRYKGPRPRTRARTRYIHQWIRDYDRRESAFSDTGARKTDYILKKDYLLRRARQKDYIRARRKGGVSSYTANKEFDEAHYNPQLVHTRPRAGVWYYVRARRQVGPSGWRGVVDFPPAWRPRAGVVLRCRCHSACTVVCRF